MSSFTGVHVSDQWLQTQFTQLQLLNFKDKFVAFEKQNGVVTIGDLPPLLAQLKASGEVFMEEDIRLILRESESDMSSEVWFEGFLRAYLNIQARAAAKLGNLVNSSSFLNSTTTTLLHTISESEKASYVAHINSYLRDDPFLKQFLPIDPTTNHLFELAKDGVLLCKLINVAVPNTIDERAINTKSVLNPWERNENHTLCLNSAKAIGCTVVNIGTQDLIEGRPHLVLGLISQIIKIQLLADLNLRKTPQLVELVEDNNDVEEIMALAPEKVLLKWMNFHLKKAGYKKAVTNFSSDLKDGEAYAYLLNVLAPEHSSPSTLDIKNPAERANLVLEHAEKMDCKRYLTPEDIVDGSPNLNLAFVAQIFHQRNGLSTDSKKISFAEMMTDDEQISREERWFRLWINSLGISSYVNHMFEDVRSGWILLEVLDKVSPGSVNWKQATKPPIKMPFRKVENCNQVIKIGKQLKFSLVNVAGNDFVQGNKKLILAFLWQLMRFNMLQLLKNLRSRSQGKEITDTDILIWANKKVRSAGRNSQMESFKDKNLSSGLFFLELLSAVEPRVVNWNLVTKGESDEKKKLNATYIISVARKLGCSIFLLPEDIMEVNQKMILMLTASIMYWSLQHSAEESKSSPSHVATSNADTSVHSEASAFPVAVSGNADTSPATSIDSEASAFPAVATSNADTSAATSVDSEASAFPAVATNNAATSIDSEAYAFPTTATSNADTSAVTSIDSEASNFPTATSNADTSAATSVHSEASAFPAAVTSNADTSAATSIDNEASAFPAAATSNAATSIDSEASAFPTAATSNADTSAATSVDGEATNFPAAATSNADTLAATSIDSEAPAFLEAATSIDSELSAPPAAATSTDNVLSAFPAAASPLDSVDVKSSPFTAATLTTMNSSSVLCMKCYSPLTPATATISDAARIANLNDEDEYTLIQGEKGRRDSLNGCWRGFELDY